MLQQHRKNCRMLAKICSPEPLSCPQMIFWYIDSFQDQTRRRTSAELLRCSVTVQLRTAIGFARMFLFLRFLSNCPMWYKATWSLGICHLFISDTQITASFRSMFWHRKAPTAEKYVLYANQFFPPVNVGTLPIMSQSVFSRCTIVLIPVGSIEFSLRCFI